MAEKNWLRPVPKVIISYYEEEAECGEITTYVSDCSYDPPLVMIGLERDGDARQIIRQKEVFAINLVADKLTEIYDKIKTNGSLALQELDLKINRAAKISAPILSKAPVNIECEVINSILTGSHEMFVGRIKTVHADEELVTEAGKIDFTKINFFK